MTKRIFYFGFGLILGLIFLYFFFKGKNTEFCYLPNCRVLKDIRKKELVFTKAVEDSYNFKGKDSVILNNALRHGDVVFDKSDTKGTPCKTYVIENEGRTFTIENCNKLATVKKVE